MYRYKIYSDKIMEVRSWELQSALDMVAQLEAIWMIAEEKAERL